MSRNRGLQVTDTKPNRIEVRALVSSADAGKNFDLRCQVREGLLDFLRVRYPESLPQVRIMWQRLEETPQRKRATSQSWQVNATSAAHRRRG